MNARKCVHAQKPYSCQAFTHESSKFGGRGKREEEREERQRPGGWWKERQPPCTLNKIIGLVFAMRYCVGFWLPNSKIKCYIYAMAGIISLPANSDGEGSWRRPIGGRQAAAYDGIADDGWRSTVPGWGGWGGAGGRWPGVGGRSKNVPRGGTAVKSLKGAIIYC